MSRVKISMLFILFILMLIVVGCSGQEFSPESLKEPPTELAFEETTKGVYLRFDFDDSQKYKYIYEIKIYSDEVLRETKKMTTDLPILEFTDLLRDESLELVFRVKVASVNDLNVTTDYSSEISYIYDINKVHFTTAPIVQNISINENYIIEWEKIEGIKEYEIILNHYFKDNSIQVIKIKVKDNNFDLSKTILVNDQKLTVQIKSIGSFVLGEKYFHSSELSEEYTVFEVLSEGEN